MSRPYHPRNELVDGYRIREHPLYMVHANMLQRCNNPNAVGYENYGGRGIKVCDRWNRFTNFLADMGMRPSPAHTIERQDNNGNYEPGNCVWDTRTAQCLNRRRFKSNTSGATGIVKTASGWHARFDYEHTRYNIGWFARKIEAVLARAEFVELFLNDRESALAAISDRVRNNSTTRHRGVTPCEDGFIARCTIDGIRHYIGYFKRIEDAVAAREKFIASRTGRVAGRIQST